MLQTMGRKRGGTTEAVRHMQSGESTGFAIQAVERHTDMNCRSHVVRLTSVSVGLLFAASAHAAATKVNQSDWWGGITGYPSYVNMYIYVPSAPAAKPPIVVVPHHCGGDASSSYSENSGLVSLANSNGFIMVFPEATGQNCWDAGSDRSLNHSGKGDAPAIVQMVKYTIAKYNADASRVYSVGGSSGGIMTEALLGVFPDVFTAGISIMGVPCGCWAQDYHDVTGKPSDGTGQWSGPCAGGSVNKTGSQWGDLVRSYFPGYTGHRPRLQHWHGTSDTTLSYKNVAEDIEEWTNLLGLSETPTGSDTPKSGTTRQYWKNSCGYTVYEVFSLAGVGHSVSVDASTTATYFGLNNKATTVDPETAACAAGGNSGIGGATSAGGTAAAGGSETGGKTSTLAATGGRTGTQGTGGTRTSGGAPGTGGAQSTGGSNANGGSSALTAGGRVGTGGRPMTGGASAGTDLNGTGGMAPAGGADSTGGSSVQVPIESSLTGGAKGVGGASADAGGSSSIASTSAADTREGGCSCAVVGRTGHAASSATTLLFAALAMAMRRKSRRG